MGQGPPTEGYQTQSWKRERLGVAGSEASPLVSLKRAFFIIFPGVVVDALTIASRLFIKSWRL